ncbi:MAG: hypothetical protein OSJ45_10005 [Lachnospiraceae bacterium]|nr:hypothetical protein [Lachnospiraceae bacterium]
MVKKRNYYENSLYGNDTGNNTAESNICFNLKKPSQVLHWLIYLIKDPAGAIRQAAAVENMAQPLTLAGINVLSVFLASIICVVVMNVRYSFYFSWVHIPSAGIIIFSVLLATVFDFGFPGLLFVSTSIIFKEKTTFAKMLSLSGGKVIIDSVFILAGSVFMMLSNFFFLLFAIAGNIISFTALVTAYNKETKLPAAKKIYSFSGSLAIISIIMAIILKVVSPLFIGNIYSYAGLW